jgi:hypothetical protein
MATKKHKNHKTGNEKILEAIVTGMPVRRMAAAFRIVEASWFSALR